MHNKLVRRVVNSVAVAVVSVVVVALVAMIKDKIVPISQMNTLAVVVVVVMAAVVVVVVVTKEIVLKVTAHKAIVLNNVIVLKVIVPLNVTAMKEITTEVVVDVVDIVAVHKEVVVDNKHRLPYTLLLFLNMVYSWLTRPVSFVFHLAVERPSTAFGHVFVLVLRGYIYIQIDRDV